MSYEGWFIQPRLYLLCADSYMRKGPMLTRSFAPRAPLGVQVVRVVGVVVLPHVQVVAVGPADRTLPKSLVGG